MTGPDPAVAQTRVAVRRVLAGLPHGVVLVACSGGPDSLALTAATIFEARRSGHTVAVVTVDHGLQPGSAEVAAQVAATATRLGADSAEVITVSVIATGDGPEAAARTARYRALGEATGRHDAVAVLLGHSLDDQAEQVLLGLARGSGARSLAGMPARRGLFVRPFLGVDRATILRAVEALGLTPWHDPTNLDPAYTRSRVRTDLLPAMEAALGLGVRAALARTAEQLREDADCLDALAAEALRALTRESAKANSRHPRSGVEGPLKMLTGDTLTDDAPATEGAPSLPVAGLQPLPDALRRRVLLQWLRAVGCPAGDLSRTHVLAVDALVTDWRGQGPIWLPTGLRVERVSGRLIVVVAA